MKRFIAITLTTGLMLNVFGCSLFSDKKEEKISSPTTAKTNQEIPKADNSKEEPVKKEVTKINLKSYTGRDTGNTMYYPEGWKKTGGSAGTDQEVYFIGPTGQEELIYKEYIFDPQAAKEALAMEGFDVPKDMEGWKILDQSLLTFANYQANKTVDLAIGGINGYQINYLSIDPQNKVQGFKIRLQKENKVIEISANGPQGIWEKNLPALEKAISMYTPGNIFTAK